MEIKLTDSKISITENKQDIITINSDEIYLEDLHIDMPGEYEKNWTLLEAKEYENKLFYKFTANWKHLLVVPHDIFEMKEEIMSFFGDVDILIIKWTKSSAKIIENIEANTVIPYWEEKDVFLSTLWQHKEEVNPYKVKSETLSDTTEIVNLG